MLTTIICFTMKGAYLCERIKDDFDPVQCYSKYNCNDNLLPIKDNLKDIIKAAFHQSEAIIFIGAAGIAVRLIAPYITTKDKDPAVLVIDENGKFVIPILSGHLGGANKIACEIADKIRGQAVITTATDCNQVFAVDVWAKEQELYIHNINNIKYISSALLRGEQIGFVSEYLVETKVPDFFTKRDAKAGILISEDITKAPFHNTLNLSPKCYVLGIGCRKDTDILLLEDTVLASLQRLNISPSLLKAVATINIKAEEPAIKAFCAKYRLNLSVYSSEELCAAEGEFTPSEFVKSIVGVDNVCERAACLASNQGEFLQRKTSSQGITVAIAKTDWRCRF